MNYMKKSFINFVVRKEVVINEYKKQKDWSNSVYWYKYG